MKSVDHYIKLKIKEKVRQPLISSTSFRKEPFLTCIPIIKNISGGVYLKLKEENENISTTHHTIEREIINHFYKDKK